MSYAKQREHRLKLERFLDEYGNVIGNALIVYAEKYRNEAKPLLERYEAIKDDEEARADQDKTWVTTLGLRHMAGLFGEAADKAERAVKELAELQEEDEDDDD